MKTDFVICIKNENNLASLIVGKVYRRLVDKDADTQQMYRIIDEDKTELDGYLYPTSFFVPIDVPDAAKQVLVGGGG